jgi:serine protease inhibitor
MNTQDTSMLAIAQTDDLSFELLRREAAAKPNEDVSICGIGVSSVMGMVYNGARGKTAEGILKALYLSGDRDYVNNAYARLIAGLTAGDLGVTLKLANALYANKDVKFDPAYLMRMRSAFAASIQNRDFSKPDDVLNLESDDPNKQGINPWCRKFTDGRIPSILKELNPAAILVLLTGLSFEGGWTSEFDIANTTVAKFFATEGEADHDIMFQQGEFVHVEHALFDLVAMPFAEQQRVVKHVLLPKKGVSTTDVLATLNRSTFWALTRNQWPTLGNLWFPRYTSSTEAELGTHLKEMGAELAFGGGDFGDMASGNNKLSRVVQKNVATFDEFGGKVDSITAGEMMTESVCIPPTPWNMRVDRPFISVTADVQTGGIILANVVNKPKRAPVPTKKA